MSFCFSHFLLLIIIFSWISSYILQIFNTFRSSLLWCVRILTFFYDTLNILKIKMKMTENFLNFASIFALIFNKNSWNFIKIYLQNRLNGLMIILQLFMNFHAFSLFLCNFLLRFQRFLSYFLLYARNYWKMSIDF